MAETMCFVCGEEEAKFKMMMPDKGMIDVCELCWHGINHILKSRKDCKDIVEE